MPELITSLPVEKAPIDDREKYLLDSYFPVLNDPVTKKKAMLFRDPVIGAIIFGVLSLPFITDLIYKIFPITENNFYYLLGFKMIAFIFIFFFASNFNLMKK